MPFKTFATLILLVIAAAGLTIAVLTQTGVPLVFASLAALIAAAALRFAGPRP